MGFVILARKYQQMGKDEHKGENRGYLEIRAAPLRTEGTGGNDPVKVQT